MGSAEMGTSAQLQTESSWCRGQRDETKEHRQVHTAWATAYNALRHFDEGWRVALLREGTRQASTPPRSASRTSTANA